jgi:hypothetical protein
MTPGEQVVNHAMQFVGVHENPMGSNRGNPEPSGWMREVYGSDGIPWCACFVTAQWRSLGPHADDGLGSASTQLMYDTARQTGAVLAHPVPGCAFVYPGVHTGLVTHVLSGSVVATVEGNHGDAVATDQRAYGPGTGLYFIAPKAIRENAAPPAPPERLYYIENLSAQPVLYGPWRSQKLRDARLAKLPLARRKAARPVQTAPGKYGWLEGPRKLLGPWGTAAARDTALKTLQARHPGTPYRAMSKVHTVNAVGSALGKTT